MTEAGHAVCTLRSSCVLSIYIYKSTEKMCICSCVQLTKAMTADEKTLTVDGEAASRLTGSVVQYTGYDMTISTPSVAVCLSVCRSQRD